MFTVLYILPYDVKCDIKHQTKHYYQNDVNLNSKPVIRYVIFIGFCRPCNCCMHLCILMCYVTSNTEEVTLTTQVIVRFISN